MRNLILVLGVLLPSTVFAQVGIRNTDHDLSRTSTGTPLQNASTVTTVNNQICIYCHTPHRAQSTQFLWNHTATTVTSWNWGNDLDGNAMTKTTAGTPLPSTLRSGSKRCLGCHDGSVAIGDVSNAGDGFAGRIPGLENVTGITDSSGKLIAPDKLIGAGGNMGGNHPVSIPYAGQTGYNGLTSSAPADGMIGNYYAVTTAGCTSPTGICTTAPSSATEGTNGAAINLIPNVAGGTTNVGVECSSCHEPHNKYGFPWFTRVDVSNASGLCRSCHNK